MDVLFIVVTMFISIMMITLHFMIVLFTLDIPISSVYITTTFALVTTVLLLTSAYIVVLVSMLLSWVTWQDRQTDGWTYSHDEANMQRFHALCSPANAWAPAKYSFTITSCFRITLYVHIWNKVTLFDEDSSACWHDCEHTLASVSRQKNSTEVFIHLYRSWPHSTAHSTQFTLHSKFLTFSRRRISLP